MSLDQLSRNDADNDASMQLSSHVYETVFTTLQEMTSASINLGHEVPRNTWTSFQAFESTGCIRYLWHRLLRLQYKKHICCRREGSLLAVLQGCLHAGLLGETCKKRQAQRGRRA